jgi:hypothetical protein
VDSLQETQLPSEAVLERIDGILRDLIELRQTVVAQGRVAQGNLATDLFGALGRGSWDEYSLELDWQRFDS